MGTFIPGDQLASTLFSKARQAVLGLLYTRPDEAFYLRQIVELTGLGMGHVQRELKQLTQAGVIRRQERGRHVYFQADPSCPVFDELRGIVRKTTGSVSLLRHALEPMLDRIVVAFIYGSVARGQEHKASDLDLMVIGDVMFGEVAQQIRTVEAQIHREINPTVYPVAELRAKLTTGHHFLTTVLSAPKMFLIGDENELRDLVP